MRVLYWTGAGIGNLIQATPAFFEISVLNEHELTVYPEDVPFKFLQSIYPFKVDLDSGATFMTHRPTRYEMEDNFDVVIYSEFRGIKPPPPAKNLHKPKMNWWKESESDYHLRVSREILGLKETSIGKIYCVNKENYDIKQPKNKKVAIAPCGKSTQGIKKWPYFPELSKELIRRGWEVFVVGTRQDVKAEHYPGATFVVDAEMDYVGQIFEGCNFIVTNDCGMMHYSNALGVKTYAIFGPSSVIKNKPEDVIEISVRSCQYQPCQEQFGDWAESYKKKRCYNECLIELGVDDVISGIGELNGD